MTVDFTLALVKQGAPVDVVVFYFTSMVVLFIFVHMTASRSRFIHRMSLKLGR